MLAGHAVSEGPLKQACGEALGDPGMNRSTLAYKAASGLDGLIAGIALEVICFPTDFAARGAGAMIPDAVVRITAALERRHKQDAGHASPPASTAC